MAKYILVLCMLLTTVKSQKCDAYGFLACLEDLYGFIRFSAATKEQLDEECSKVEQSLIPCFEGMYRNCETLHIDTSGAKSYLKVICEPGTFHDEYLKHSECFSNFLGDLSICNEYTDKHEKERMKYICCSEQNKITECVQAKARVTCGLRATSFVHELNKRTSEIFPKSMCDDEDTCDAGRRQSTSWNILSVFFIALLAMLVK